jgi:glycerol kinase
MAYLLALDEGTSSARAIVFDRQGQIYGLGRRSFQQYYPSPERVEQDAAEIWQAQLAAGREAIEQAGLDARQIAGIGITNQRETTVLWDRSSGQPLHRAIVWQDRRTASYCEALKNEGHEAAVQHKTGLVLDPYFSATKLNWLLANVEGARERAEQGELAFGTIDSWLLWNLTGGEVHATDPSNAARTLLYNIHTGEWDDALCRLFEIPKQLLPAVYPNAHAFGTTSLFGGSLPIAGMIGDQQGATFGQASFRPGIVKNTYGTGCFLLMNTGATPIASEHGLLTTLGWQLGKEQTYALEGAIFSAGASMNWLQSIGLIQDAQEAEDLAAWLPDNQGVYFVPAFSGLGAPQWDPEARGTILGLTHGSGRAHLARAALEAMAYQSDEVLQAMSQDSNLAAKMLRVDGGASQNSLLMQFQADLSGLHVERPVNIETTAWGAALLAGLATNVFQGLDEIEQLRRTDKRFLPQSSHANRQAHREQWQIAVRRAMHWAD